MRSNVGRRSWEIFGPDLTSAHNIVVSRSLTSAAGATVVDRVDLAVEVAREYGREVFCAGGAQLYAQTLPLADGMYLSYIKGEFEGDVFFPEFDEARWTVVEETPHAIDERHAHAFVFETLDRKR